MELFWILVFSIIYPYARGQGVYAPANAKIVHEGQACVVKDDNISERIYTIREGDHLVLKCLVKGHPLPQVRWTKTAGSASDKFQETSIYNETLIIEGIQRVQGGRYYCKADNGVGVAAIKSIRVDVQYLDKPVLTVHQTISDVRGSYYQEKTVFLRCTVNSNPPARFIWKRGTIPIEQSKDQGVDIYEPLYTQGETKVLKLKNLRLKDFANYTCQVSVRNVCEIPDSSVTFLLTNGTTPPALRLSVNESLVVDPGKDVTLSCEVTAGLPKPTVTWSRYLNPLPRNSLVRNGTLELRSVTPADSGFYNCTAANNVGNPAKRNVNLLVRSMGNLTFQITPDSNKDSENIQMGRDLKLSCHVDAQPQDKVNYMWYQNEVLIYNSDSLIVLHSDPDMAPGTSSLEIVDMKFRDQATYSCVANFPGSTVPELRVDVNITQNSVTPPILTVPEGGQVVSVREGGTTDLVCLVDGKPRPPVLWSRADKDLAMPTGEWAVETRDGRLHLTNVTRDLMGAYRCQTAPYNGLNIKPRQAQVQLNVQYAPVLDPVFQDVRSPNYQFVTLRCIIQKSNPPRIASVRWTRNGEPLTSLTPHPQENPQLKFKLDPSNNGTYKCHVSNGVGSSTCTFNISSRPYNAEFYFDTPNPICNLKGNNFSYNLQWTQSEPAATDRIIGYWVNVRNNEKMNQMNLFSKQINTKEPVKGSLMSYILTDLKIPLSYEIRLAPITTYSTGDYVSRTIKYTEYHVCGFEDKHICGFSQDRGDNFDWTRQNHLTQNPKRSSNTGPEMDRSGTKEGCYMYIEASRPRVLGDTARLLSPLYNVTAARGPKGSGRLPYCISFFYHMKGKQIGTLDVWLRVKSIASVDTKVWSLIGNQGPDWNQANIIVNPSGPFQVVFQAIRGSGYEGDIAIDDVSVTRGKCKQENSVSNTVLIGEAPALCSHPLAASLTFALCSFLLLLYR
ncbi:MAM domain-containing glycosylphosphatidylinositol anchor protein 1 [Salmo salar]|uniref:MAM domain-containing glycosylphosphatidylinositol anchor protein 1 n=1 Tax=Salmo salar TaxID=8030 RepID=A0A1S3SM98_SALSA|nr:MAM domain-containing glycosylphosphatidylinositol anchor protein 1 [Salmo salar]|eukprot:XP_014065463.1 PREDICTED: MAM domain-containing glycosylphosphatidylinositol anchor protein 1-like isoform X1 [Salmo salar]